MPTQALLVVLVVGGLVPARATGDHDPRGRHAPLRHRNAAWRRKPRPPRPTPLPRM